MEAFNSGTPVCAAPASPGVRRYSTRGVPAARRLQYWNDLAAQAFGPLVIDARTNETFAAEMGWLSLGECDLISTWSKPSILRCRSRSNSSAIAPLLLIGVQISGHSLGESGGQRWAMRPGDLVLSDPCQPFTCSVDAPSHILTLRIPRARLEERLGDVDRYSCVGVSGTHGPGAALSSLIRGLWPAAANASTESWAPQVMEVVLDLAELVFKSHPATVNQPVSLLEARRAQATALIEQRLGDPEFNSRAIAERLGVSLRYVQMLFAPLGITPSAYILNRRLQLAAFKFRANGSPRVSDIAFAVGFTDPSYFCRAFREHYGRTPREYRAGLHA